MSVIRNSMEDNMSQGTPSTAWDYAGPNDIRVPYNPCGCVYAFDVLPGSYDVTSMYGESSAWQAACVGWLLLHSALPRHVPKQRSCG